VSEVIRSELARVASALGAGDAPFVLERPRETGHGDLATNLAMRVARARKVNPRTVAEEILDMLRLPEGVVSRVEIAGPGFINFWLAQDTLAEALQRIVTAGERYGRSDGGRGLLVNVEFVSANPTGPLHVGHGRGAALGDGIAALLEWTGHEVTREFYINDAGAQIDRLVRSLWARVQQRRGRDEPIPEGGYHGEYLVEAAERALHALEAPLFEGTFEAAALTLRWYILELQREEQDTLLKDFGVEFDVHTSEQQRLYEGGLVQGLLDELAAKGLTYEKDGALWLRTEEHGDDKDRVLRKSDGSLTYVVPDIAYHRDKHERGFHRAIDIWGADHHGYVPRMRAALRALGYGDDFFEVVIVQLVKVMKGGEEVRMSKRAGDFVTLRDLLDWVGVDASAHMYTLLSAGDIPIHLPYPAPDVVASPASTSARTASGSSLPAWIHPSRGSKSS
jgi:arginyl-tRNA synthetase